MENSKRKNYMLSIITVLMIYTFGNAGAFMPAAVQSYMEAWPDISQTGILMVNTIPALVSMPMLLFVGAFVGTKISYKKAALISPDRDRWSAAGILRTKLDIRTGM